MGSESLIHRKSAELVRGLPKWEYGYRNGVRFKIRRNENGSSCETACHCLGIPGRTHSSFECPNRRPEQEGC